MGGNSGRSSFKADLFVSTNKRFEVFADRLRAFVEMGNGIFGFINKPSHQFKFGTTGLRFYPFPDENGLMLGEKNGTLLNLHFF